MTVIEDVLNCSERFPHVALTVGSFDGVHLGHQRILEQVVRSARETDGTAAVLTLRPHPREFFAPDHAPNLLTSDVKKFELFEKVGIDVVYVLKFDARVANLLPGEFVREILCERCHVENLIVGHDFRFGRKAEGDFEFLIQQSAAHGFRVSQAPVVLIDGERVSSTLIRERLLAGDLAEVETFLGRKYSIVGEVVSGRSIGKTLGFPTANVQPYHSAVPAQGVYAAEVLIGDARHRAAVNIGIAPTIRNEDVIVEAHVLDFSEDVLGNEIEVIFHKRLRPEKKFASREELVRQIAQDVQDIRAYFSQPTPVQNSAEAHRSRERLQS